jgi:signal transduction histidine kinase
MTTRRQNGLAACLFGLTLAAEIAAVSLALGVQRTDETLLYAIYSITLAGAGALILRAHPRHPIGWLFCGFALLNAVTADLAQGYALRAAQEDWPGSSAAEWINSTSWLPSGLGWILTFLLFPDGRLLGARWRIVPWVAGAGLALALPGWSLSPDRAPDYASGGNPLATNAVPTGALLAVGMALFVGALLASIASLIVRFRRSRGLERLQLKWFAFAAAAAGVILPLTFLLWYVTPAARVLAALALTALPIAACIAILRYRLYEIDVVINRTLVYGGLTIVLAGAYGGTILLLGTALGRQSAWATAAATLVAAVAFRPLRGRLQDAVDRRFNRARYGALRKMTAFLDALRAGRADPEQVVDLLRDVVCDPSVDILFRVADDHYVDLQGAPIDELRDDRRDRIPIERAGQPLGVVLHASADQEQLRLLRRLIEAGGLAIEIARLQVELRRQLAEVEASRARIVEAGNAERRRIERDLHDGAQQRLVSIGLALRHAQHELRTGSTDNVIGTLDGAVEEVADAIDELRELAQGLPPSQLDAGLGPAFRELARRAPLRVEVNAPIDRFGPGIEAAAYFVGCEGLTNAIKHAQATWVTVSAVQQNGRLVVSVSDNGVGGAVLTHGSGLTGLHDRVATLGGTLRLESDQAAGTTLTAELPCGS